MDAVTDSHETDDDVVARWAASSLVMRAPLGGGTGFAVPGWVPFGVTRPPALRFGGAMSRPC